MPVTATIGAASSRGFGFLGITQSSGPFWIGQMYSGDEEIGSGTATDSSGNVYIAGYSKPGPGNENFQFAKFSPAGSLLWQRSLSGASSDIAYAIKTDSSDNVYVAGFSRQAGIAKIEVAKYDSSGAIQWQKAIGEASVDVAGENMAIDGAGNIYVVGGSGAAGVVVKLDSSAVIQWQMKLSATTSAAFTGVAVNAAGDVGVVGEAISGATNSFVTALYNSSGVLQWQRTLDSVVPIGGSGCTIDGDSNVYVCGTAAVSGAAYGVSAKYNSSGTLQWQRQFGAPSADVYWMGMAMDARRNLYMVGYDTGAFPNDIAQMARYSTNGVLQWQRTMNSSALDAWVGVSVDSRGVIYPNGYSTVRGSPDFLFAKLPVSGALTGTYSVDGNSFTYAASTLTDAAASFTDSVGSLTSATATLSVATSTLTDAASGLSSVVTTI